jgi:hypothetical protein
MFGKYCLQFNSFEFKWQLIIARTVMQCKSEFGGEILQVKKTNFQTMFRLKLFNSIGDEL